jgi:hypothetical protein
VGRNTIVHVAGTSPLFQSTVSGSILDDRLQPGEDEAKDDRLKGRDTTSSARSSFVSSRKFAEL